MDKLSENLKPFIPICTVIIAFTAVLSLLLVGVNALLSPIKANQIRIESNLTRVETELEEIKDTLKKIVEKQESSSKPRRGTASQEK